MEELKRCPFCGGKAELSVKHGFKGEVIAAFVYCTKCGVSTLSYASQSTAIESWNRGKNKR